MNEKQICDMLAHLVRVEGVSKKTGKPFSMLKLRVESGFGDVDIMLDTVRDRSGIVLDMVARKEEA